MADFTNEETRRLWANRVRTARPDSFAVRATIRRVGQRMLTVSRRNMNQGIYAKPEDVSRKTGKPKWVRTGKLLAAEKLEYAPDGSGVMLNNTMVYAHARHELGRDGRKTTREAHWRDGIFDELRSAVQDELQQLTARILRGQG